MRSCSCCWWLATGWCAMLAETNACDAIWSCCSARDSLCSTGSRCDGIWKLRIVRIHWCTLPIADTLVHPPQVWAINMILQVSHTWRQRSGKPSCHTACRKWKCGSPVRRIFPNCLALKIRAFLIAAWTATLNEGKDMLGPVPV